DAVEQPEPLSVGVGAHRLGETGDTSGQLGHDSHQLAAERSELGAHTLLRAHRNGMTQRLRERRIGRAELLVAPSPQHDGTSVMCDSNDLGDDARLADARLAGYEHRTARTLHRLLPRPDEVLNRLGPSRERERGVDVDARGERELAVAA